jgi:chromosome segregation ATPase
MLNLEQVKLLETKVANAIDYVQRVTGENAALRKKLEANQKRIDELEVLVTRFKEDQGRIEDGILAALDRLNQFEDAVEKSLAGRNKETKSSPSDKAAKPSKDGPPADKAPPAPKAPAEVNIADPVTEDSGEKPDNGELDIF